MEPKIPAARPSSDEDTTKASGQTTGTETGSAPGAGAPSAGEAATGETTAEPTGQAGGAAEVPTEARAARAAGTARARTGATARIAAIRPAKTTPLVKATRTTRATAATKMPVTGATPAAKMPAAAKATTPAKTVTVAAPATTPVPAPLWERLRANPRYAPELLAVAAVQVVGAQADEYVRWLTATYPYATGDSIARYVAGRYTRQAGFASLAGTLARPWGALAGLAAYTWVRTRLVLLTAAAYGHDPRDPERVPELLVLLGVHPDLPAARAALVAAQTGRRSAQASGAGGWLGLAKALATPLGRVAVRRGRPGALSLPGARPLAGVLVDGSAADALARRAAALYRPNSGS